jgi:hypothetical protein
MSLPVEIGQAISTHREPLKPGGFLEQFKHFDVTPTIGREYSEANLKEWLEVILSHFSLLVFVYYLEDRHLTPMISFEI